MSSYSIAIVGSVALDTIETPFKRKENLIGGSATYATIAAGRSSSVYPVGIVGNDFPKKGFEIFQKYSADLSDFQVVSGCLLYTSPSPRDGLLSRMPSSA